MVPRGKRGRKGVNWKTETNIRTLLYIKQLTNKDLLYGTGEGSGTPPQYSCLEDPMDRGAWWAAVHGVAKSQT